MLDLGVGVDALDGLGEAFQAVHAGDQDILDATVVQVGEDAEPVMRPFLVGEIEAQQLLFALDVESQDGIDGLAGVATVLPDLVVNLDLSGSG